MSIGSEITQLLLNQGNIAANAAQQSGQIAGQTISGVSQAAQGTLQALTDPKMQEYRRSVDGRKALAMAIKSTPMGKSGPDYEGIATKLSAQGFPDIAESWLSTATKNKENLSKLDEMKRAALKANQDLQAHTMATIGDAAFHATSPADFTSSVGLLAAHGQIDEKTANGILGAADQSGPNGWEALRANYLKFSPARQKQQEERAKPVVLPPTPRGGAPAQQVSGGQVLATGGAASPAAPTETEVALQAAGGDPTQAMAILKPKAADSDQKQPALIDGKPGFVLVDPKKPGDVRDLNGQPITDAAKRVKPIPTAAQVSITGGTLSQAALDQAAQKYLETGILPPGFGTAGVLQKTAIQNRAAEMDPKAALARNQAVFKADQANLVKLQTTEGTLSAFERTAGKNLDQFLSTAAKIPDTGVPWVNAPIRTVNAKLLGSEDQAAFNAARDVALREIARVTNDPKLSGALTDSARAEVAGLSPANATFAQIKRVAQVLKQDMANVHSGLNEQIASVKAGLGQSPMASTGTPPRVRKYNPATGKLE